MDGNGKPGRAGATEPDTLLLMVCTRCLGLRKEHLGRTTAVCGCGGQRRILRVVHDEPEPETPPRRGGMPRPRANGAGPSNGAGPGNGTAPGNGAGPGERAARRPSSGRFKRRPPNGSS